MTPAERKSNIFVIAGWAATLFGLLEGAVLCITRGYPLIEAAHKVSAEVLWVAPLVDLPVFLVAALGLWLPFRLLRRRLGKSELLAIYGVFIWLGFYTVVTAPRVIQTFGAVMLSLGLTAVVCRSLRGSEDRLTASLRRGLAGVPLLIGVAWLGIFSYEALRETAQARALPAPPADAKNVLVIVLDTVRADRFSLPDAASLTPNLDRFAASGVRFDRAWSTSTWSLPSQASILTGRYPSEHEADWPKIRIANRMPTLGEFLAGRGYATGAFSSNAAWVTPEYLGRGFLRFDVYQFEDLARRTVHGRKIDKLLEKVGYHSAGRGKSAPRLNAQFLKFLDDYRGRPFFAYFCYMDVNRTFHDSRMNKHEPVPAVLRAYDRALTLLDAQIGELRRELAQRGVLENTLLVITSDHGESFGAKETADHDPAGHGSSLYREQSAVPLIVVAPGQVPAGRRMTGTASIVQIPATLTALLGANDSRFPGEPLPVLPGDVSGSQDATRSALAEIRNPDGKLISESVLADGWQYIHNPTDHRDLRKGEELYDLAADPLEKNNLAATAESQAILAKMREELKQLRTANAGTKTEGPK